MPRKDPVQQGVGIGDGACIGGGTVGVAKILYASLQEACAALAALPKHLTEISVAPCPLSTRTDMVETNRDGELRPEAQDPPGFAFGEEYPAAEIFAGHVEKRIRRLQDRNIGRFRATFFKKAGDGACRPGKPRFHADYRVPDLALACASRIRRTSETSADSGTVTCAGRVSRQVTLSSMSADSRFPSTKSLI